MQTNHNTTEAESRNFASDLKVLQRLVVYTRPYRSKIVLALLITLALNGLRATLPLFTRYAIDWYITPGRIAGLKWLALVFLGMRFINFGFFYKQNVLLSNLSQSVIYDLRCELFARLQQLDVAYFDRTPIGRILTRLTVDFESLTEIMTSCIKDGVGDAFMTISIVGIMLWTDWRLTLVTLAVLPPIVLAMKTFRRRMQRAHNSVRGALAGVSAFLQERLSGVLVLQLHNSELRSLKKLERLNRDYREAIKSHSIEYGVFVFVID